MNRKIFVFTLIFLFPVILVAGRKERRENRKVYEHFGARFEVMNLDMVNLYGFGSYTHTRHIDYEMLFYFNPRSFSVYVRSDIPDDYPALFASFGVRVRPFLFSKYIIPYAATGYFPFITRGYLYHMDLGLEFRHKGNFHIDINLKRIYVRESSPFDWLPESKWALAVGFRI